MSSCEPFPDFFSKNHYDGKRCKEYPVCWVEDFSAKDCLQEGKIDKGRDYRDLRGYSEPNPLVALQARPENRGFARSASQNVSNLSYDYASKILSFPGLRVLVGFPDALFFCSIDG
jgi:hypothetical protein